jgi:hypothetical protein
MSHRTFSYYFCYGMRSGIGKHALNSWLKVGEEKLPLAVMYAFTQLSDTEQELSKYSCLSSV